MARDVKKVGPPKRYRKPNALKHGGFSSIELFPWENAEEFEKRHRDLIEQYQPRGPLQEDCIRTVASYLWRKQRVGVKRRLDTAAALESFENRVLREHPPPLFDDEVETTKYVLASRLQEPRHRAVDDYQQLLGFSSSLYRQMRGMFLPLMIKMLPREFADHLQEKVPQANYETTDQWVVALKREVDGVLLPMVRERRPDRDRYHETAANVLTQERLLADLDLEERFDMAIDRALKRFFNLQMADQLSSARTTKLITPKVTAQLTPPDQTSTD